MKLEGYRCDRCKVESYEKPGDWFQVVSTRVTHGVAAQGHRANEFPELNPMWGATFATPTHYCSKECLVQQFGEADD